MNAKRLTSEEARLVHGFRALPAQKRADLLTLLSGIVSAEAAREARRTAGGSEKPYVWKCDPRNTRARA